ncbi:MAG TPA: TetR/AcrR family transcriptional regulator [Actinomycetaceae bacterium]|nr:TetR/AcrR family transcriptional regulator [Actinomycetaceae bacterium]
MYPITEQSGPHVNSNGGDPPIPAGSRTATTTDDDRTAKAPDGRTTRWVEHRERRRLEMVRQIRRIVHENGPDLSMEEIATRLGTSKSILYRYFDDKTALQVALGEYILGRARGYLTEASRSSREPRRAITAMVNTYLEIVERSRNVFLFVNRPQYAASEGTLRVFVRQIEEVVTGVLTPLVAPTTTTARIALWAAGVVGLVRAAADDWINTPEETRLARAELADDLATILWNGTHGLIGRHSRLLAPPTNARDTGEDQP